MALECRRYEREAKRALRRQLLARAALRWCGEEGPDGIWPRMLFQGVRRLRGSGLGLPKEARFLVAAAAATAWPRARRREGGSSARERTKAACGVGHQLRRLGMLFGALPS